MSLPLYNPKATAPAIYIPAWLSQVPSNKLTPSCKMVYGRLAQWATNKGIAHRSAKQLSQELGIPERTVEACLKSLRENLLIGSYQPKEGGHNYFEFYAHEWMNAPINENLCYKSDTEPSPAKIAVPTAKIAVPTAKIADYKYKEIKEIKKTTTTEKKSGGSFLKTEKQRLEYKCQDDPREDEEFLDNCEHHLQNNAVKTESAYKQSKMLLGLLKKLFESGEHFKSEGYVNPKTEQLRKEQESERARIQEELSEKKRLEFIEASKSKPKQERTSSTRRFADVLKGINYANQG